MRFLLNFMDKLVFERRGKERIIEVIESGEKAVIDFLNGYSVYLYENNADFRNSLGKCRYYNFPDGVIISIFHLMKHGSWLPRTTGPEFTEFFLQQDKYMRNSRHFFLGINETNMNAMMKRFPLLKPANVAHYNPPYIKGLHFPKSEINKIVGLINKHRPDYLWMGLGNPKKEIMLGEIFGRAGFRTAFPVGAAFDFFSGAKKQAPKAVRALGLEWLFRLVTDFGYSKGKVGNSFRSLSMLNRYVVFRD